MRRRLGSGIAVALALSLAKGTVLPAPRVRAQDASCPEVAPSDAEVRRRLAWLEARVAVIEQDTRQWWSGFVAFQSMLLGVNGVLLASVEQDHDRYGPAVNLVGAALGLVTLLVFFPPILGAGDALGALPRGSDAERLASLRVAEARLRQSASASRAVTSAFAAGGAVLYAEAAALTLLFLDDADSAYLQAAGGNVYGLGRILLHPAGAIHAWRDYRARHPDAGCEPIPARSRESVPLTVMPAAHRAGAGIALTLSF